MKAIKYMFILIASILFYACDPKAEIIDGTDEIDEIDEPDEPDNSEFAYKQFILSLLECMNMQRPADSYNYSVYPGMPEWANLKSNQEMIDVSQVPKDTLVKMSTQAVIQAIWDYYLLTAIVHRGLYQADFESMFSQNNAYNELVSRKDAGQCLLTRLVLLDPIHPDPIAVWTCQAFEIVVSQPVFLSQLDDDAKKIIIETTLKNDELRQQKDPSREVLHRMTAWLLIGRTMLNAGYVPFVDEVKTNELLQSFFDAYSYVYFEALYYDTIPSLIKKYAKSI